MANPRAHDVASQATDSIRCPCNRCLCNKSHWILQRIYRLTFCNRRAFTLSRRCRVSRSRPRVSGETITVISLWRHNSGPWDNGEYIAAHSNATPRTMGSITREIRAYGYHIRKTSEYGYHIRKTKWYGYADHVGCIRVNFGQVLDKYIYIYIYIIILIPENCDFIRIILFLPPVTIGDTSQDADFDSIINAVKLKNSLHTITEQSAVTAMNAILSLC